MLRGGNMMKDPEPEWPNPSPSPNIKYTVIQGYVNSVDWNGGMEWWSDYWSGVLDWITGVPRPQMHNLVQLPWLQI